MVNRLETTQQKIERFKEVDRKMGRIPSPIENRLLICENCKRGRDHEPNECGLWNCTECGTTREDNPYKLKYDDKKC